jgi:hypothetical protein
MVGADGATPEQIAVQMDPRSCDSRESIRLSQVRTKAYDVNLPSRMRGVASLADNRNESAEIRLMASLTYSHCDCYSNHSFSERVKYKMMGHLGQRDPRLFFSMIRTPAGEDSR